MAVTLFKIKGYTVDAYHGFQTEGDRWGQLGATIELRGPRGEKFFLSFVMNDKESPEDAWQPDTKRGFIHMFRDLLPVVLDMLRNMRSYPVICELTEHPNFPVHFRIYQSGSAAARMRLSPRDPALVERLGVDAP